ncbi:MFS transporter [Novosphingobium sp. Gsoil 351]|uniref:MFS transporter n=1 Tax=Novosphingobium sp. Gsoil 351 TaxID=2675225 RepID=UPI0012B4E1D2|nr:MFS transporter [Novosphingobium sp. Gsoil 351]QGN55856.1 MFS transporter [Novosphingobium sp. Gsoil 351]
MSRRWLLVGALLLAYAVSFLDRQIVNLLVADIKADLALSDAQIGLLQGPAFGVFYALLGLPLGWLADKVHRLRLIAAGMVLWTTMTVLGGFAESFALLFVSRVGVGIGEAALVPAAVSLLADSFAPRDRALPLALFTSGVSLGAGLALAAGGALIGWVETGGATVLAERQPWQAVLILAGMAGLPLAGFLPFLGEPERREPAAAAAGGLGRHLRAHSGLFAALLAGSAPLYVFSNALAAWLPSLFQRGFGWTAGFSGTRLGLLILVSALAGNLLSGLAGRWRERAGRRDGALQVMAVGAVTLVPLAALTPLAASATLAQAGTALSYFAIALCFGVATTAFAAVTPAELRGRMTALYLMIGNLVGLGLGPPAVGLILDRGVGDPTPVGVALALVGAATVLPGAMLLLCALRWHRQVAELIEE